MEKSNITSFSLDNKTYNKVERVFSFLQIFVLNISKIFKHLATI